VRCSEVVPRHNLSSSSHFVFLVVSLHHATSSNMMDCNIILPALTSWYCSPSRQHSDDRCDSFPPQKVQIRSLDVVKNACRRVANTACVPVPYASLTAHAQDTRSVSLITYMYTICGFPRHQRFPVVTVRDSRCLLSDSGISHASRHSCIFKLSTRRGHRDPKHSNPSTINYSAFFALQDRAVVYPSRANQKHHP
jgi:hypothetical protein